MIEHRALFVTHIPFETPANVERYFRKRGIQTTTILISQDSKSSLWDKSDIIVLFGGPMGVYQANEYPWINEELQLIEDAITNGKKVLGICLGAQLIARSLGYSVYPNKHKEIGWHEVTITEDGASTVFSGIKNPLKVFQWHGDTFDLPDDALLLATSDACKNQAFLYKDHVLALQFHLEYTINSIENLLKYLDDHTQRGPFIQNEKTIRDGYIYLSELERNLNKILDNFLF